MARGAAGDDSAIMSAIRRVVFMDGLPMSAARRDRAAAAGKASAAGLDWLRRCAKLLLRRPIWWRHMGPSEHVASNAITPRIQAVRNMALNVRQGSGFSGLPVTTLSFSPLLLDHWRGWCETRDAS